VSWLRLACLTLKNRSVCALLGPRATADADPARRRAPAAEKLRLLSPASAWHLNSSYSNDPRIDARLSSRRALCCISTSLPRSVTEGALFNDVRRLLLNVMISKAVPTELLHKGR
jgi:hypothetical protein